MLSFLHLMPFPSYQNLRNPISNEFIFSGNIIAFLTVDQYSPPFTTVQQMLDTNQYVLGIPGSTVWENFFKVSMRLSLMSSQCLRLSVFAWGPWHI